MGTLYNYAIDIGDASEITICSSKRNIVCSLLRLSHLLLKFYQKKAVFSRIEPMIC